MRKAKQFLLLAVILFSQTLFSQPNFEWVGVGGDVSDDIGTGIVSDNLGNTYTCGHFDGTTDFDPGIGVYNLTSIANQNSFVVKLAPNGNFIWAKVIGTTSLNRAQHIGIDNSGNIFVVIEFATSGDFEPGSGVTTLTSNGQEDAAIVKLDGNGVFQWAMSYGGSLNDRVDGFAIDINDNLLLTGWFYGTVDMAPDPAVQNYTSVGIQPDVYIQKLDNNGNQLWLAQLSGASIIYSTSVTSDLASNIYVTGTFRNTVDFDPGSGTSNFSTFSSNYDGYLLKLNGNGNYIRTSIVASSSATKDASYQRVRVNSVGEVISIGTFEGTGSVDLDPGPGTVLGNSNGQTDTFIQKLDSTGNLIWVKTYGNGNREYLHGLEIDKQDNIYVLGYYYDTMDFDPGLGVFSMTSNGGPDIFVQSIDNAGNFDWAIGYGGTAGEAGFSFNLDQSDNIFITGYYTLTVDFDPGIGTALFSSNGSVEDLFIHKLNQCTATASTDVQAACVSYLWIDGNTYTSSNTTATHTLPNAAGCDSVVSLNLTINILPTVTAGGTATICAGQSTNLTAGGASTYAWDNGAGAGTPVSVSPSTTTTYTVTGTDGNACVNTAQVTITVNALPDVTVTTAINLLTANNINAGATYQWLDCNNNDAIIASETAQNYAVTVSGSYAVEVTENGCVDTSVCNNVVFVGINENSFGSSFTVFPNPTSGNVKIALGKIYKNINLKVMNVSGQIIDEKTYSSTKQIECKLKGKNGVYFIEITSENKEKTTIKLIKQ
ncbi:MAG: T9SS type A sorting domain-containing protein [Flavobacteriales bacterium]|nr:T9SS type A sorting domain-containing protein [Flavobacteriales bacterium]